MASRPVSYSLHKWFTSPQKDRQAEIAVQREPPDLPKSWKATEQQKSEKFLHKVAKAAEQASGPLEAIVPLTPRKQRGGRTKKAPGAPKARYKTLTGQQRVWLLDFVEERIKEPGRTLKNALQAGATRVDCSYDVAKQTFKKKDHGASYLGNVPRE